MLQWALHDSLPVVLCLTARGWPWGLHQHADRQSSSQLSASHHIKLLKKRFLVGSQYPHCPAGPACLISCYLHCSAVDRSLHCTLNRHSQKYATVQFNTAVGFPARSTLLSRGHAHTQQGHCISTSHNAGLKHDQLRLSDVQDEASKLTSACLIVVTPSLVLVCGPTPTMDPTDDGSDRALCPTPQFPASGQPPRKMLTPIRRPLNHTEPQPSTRP
jgi:hypothetical protein